MKIVILDCETTGIPPNKANYETDFMLFPHILSMSWKCIKDGQQSETFHYIVNQEGRIVPPEATKINGITQEMCDQSKFNIFSVLIQFMMDCDGADYIVGYNLYFDTSIIKASVLRIISGGKTPMEMFDKITNLLHKDKRIDIMKTCHKLFGGKWPKLSESYMKLFQENFNAHCSKDDVDATYRIAIKLIELKIIKPLFDEINGMDLTICEEEF